MSKSLNAPKSNLTKIEEKLGEEAVKKFRELNKSELELELNKISKLKEAEIILRNEDPELNEAKQKVKDLGAPYRENLKEYGLKLNFIYLLLKEMEDK